MSTLFSGINLALHALLAQQTSVFVTENNVANANTPGYRRQQVILGAAPAYPSQGMYRTMRGGQLGMGVQVDEIRRFTTMFIDGRYRQETSQANRWEHLRSTLSQIEGAFSETTGAGLSAKLDAFWTGWQNLSSNPANMAYRSELRARATDLVDAFHLKSSALLQIRKEQNLEVGTITSQINQTAERIARLNGEISTALAVGDQPNNYFDERDRLLDQLSELSGAVATTEENGQVLVSLYGHALVIGDHTFKLESYTDANQLTQVRWADGSGLRVSAGKLAGLFEVRDVIIPDLKADLDVLAGTLIAQVNAAHQTGYGLNHATGQPFFAGTDALSISLDPAIDNLSTIAAAAAADAPGDNTVAAQIAHLQHELLMSSGTETFNQYQANKVASLGQMIQQADSSAANRRLVADTLAMQRESETGVNLDEEAANLVKAQRAYQAAARLVNVMDEMIDRIINGMGIVGR